jgi:hypothetical protein
LFFFLPYPNLQHLILTLTLTLNSFRLNVRTMSERQRERLERMVDERHGFALMGSREEVRQLRVNLEEEEYQHLLEKEALILRSKHQKSKDKEAVKQAEEKGERLNALVEAAEGSQRLLERRLQAQRKETETAVGRCEALAVAGQLAGGI